MWQHISLGCHLEVVWSATSNGSLDNSIRDQGHIWSPHSPPIRGGIFSHTPSSHSTPSSSHHPQSLKRKFWNWTLGSGLVIMSASWRFVGTYSTFIFGSSPLSPFTVHDRKWWYWIAMCFVLGRNFGSFANSIAPALSSILCIVFSVVLQLIPLHGREVHPSNSLDK